MRVNDLARFVQLGGEAQHIDQRRAQIVADDIRETLNFLISTQQFGGAVLYSTFQPEIGLAQAHLCGSQLAIIAQDDHDRADEDAQQQQKRDTADDVKLLQAVQLSAVSAYQFSGLESRHLLGDFADILRDEDAGIFVEVEIARFGESGIGVGEHRID